MMAAIFLAAVSTHAQAPDSSDTTARKDTLRSRYGAYVHYNENVHTADFGALPGIPSCCNRYDIGNGNGLTIGLLYEYPFYGQWFAMLRAGYSIHDALLLADETTTVKVGGTPTRGVFRHSLATQLATWGVEPLIGYKVGGFMAMAGGRIGYLTIRTFDQKETIMEPANTGTFENGKRTRNEFAGEIPGAATFLVNGLLGIGYEFPLNRRRTWLGGPELFISYGLTPITSELDWYASDGRVGLAIKYSPLGDTIPVVVLPPIAVLPPPPPDSVEQKKPSLNMTGVPTGTLLKADIRAVGLEDDGTERPNVSIRVEEFIATEMRPLLNYIFFEENGTALQDRYQRLTKEQTAKFVVEDLHGIPVLPTYYHLLNIVGRRMHSHPKAKITLVGCNSDEGLETGKIGLSKQRADTVRKYLVDVWNIDPARIKMESRNRPSKPSDTTVVDGVIENRRVEIYSDTWEILEPVITHDTLRLVQSPDVRFRLSAVATEGVSRWTLNVNQSGQLLKQFTGLGAVPPMIDWQLKDGAQDLPTTSEPITYQLIVHDSIGTQYATNVDSLPVDLISLLKKRRNRIADKEIGNYSLILFDFDRGDLNTSNQRIGGFIKSQINPTSSVTITGYTDRIGLTDHNQRLSEWRATSTANALNVPTSQASGFGETRLLYTNELPEGRFYCRTVNVYVETPIDE